MRISINYLFLLFLLGLNTACVGTVEKASKPRTESTDVSISSDLRFEGIQGLIPISHDKMEVYFNPATGGSKNYAYLIYVGSQAEPLSATERILEKDYRGLFRYTITNLDIGTEYIVKVDVKDVETGQIYSTSTFKQDFTFGNYVADFTGISSVSNVAGLAGLDSITVRWPHATIFPSNLFGSDRDPVAYEITILDSTRLTPASLNHFDLGANEGRIVKTINYNALVNEAVIRGLESGKIYYVNIRAIHKGTVDDPNNPTLKYEMNNRYYEIETLTLKETAIQFDLNNYNVTNTSGDDITNSLAVGWGAISGIFDHFRIYYAIKPSLSISTGLDCSIISATALAAGNTGCKKVNYDVTSSIITDLASNSEYQVKLLVCIDITCESNVELPILEILAGSQVAGFSGIQSIDLASDIKDIGTISLNYNAPNFSEGFFDGLAVEYTTQKADLLAWVNNPADAAKPLTEIITDSSYTGNLLVRDFNYAVDTRITIEGINYGEPTAYCFTIYPYVYDSLGNIVYKDQNASWDCTITDIITPDKAQFEGLFGGTTTGYDVNLNWKVPTKGIYSHFEVFYRKANDITDTSFNFDAAIDDTAISYTFNAYERILLSREDGYDIDGVPLIKTNLAVPNIPDGIYIFGILTYVNLGGTAKRSEYNLNLLICTVDGTSTTPSSCTPL